MASQIVFFRKNWVDFERATSVATATEATALALYVLDRSNRTAWGTSGSVDANNTQIAVSSGGDIGTIDSVLLLGHNFLNFLLEYQDPTSLLWMTISNVVSNMASSNFFTFAAIQTANIRVTVYGTQVPNSEKILGQFIITSTLGKLAGWPVIAKPILGRNLLAQDMLSGKSSVVQNIGMYSASLTVANWSNPADLSIVESLFDNSEGFLYWPCGGDQNQFRSVRQGYRMQDIYLVRCVSEFSPEFAQGLYQSGMKLQIDLKEVVT